MKKIRPDGYYWVMNKESGYIELAKCTFWEDCGTPYTEWKFFGDETFYSESLMQELYHIAEASLVLPPKEFFKDAT